MRDHAEIGGAESRGFAWPSTVCSITAGALWLAAGAFGGHLPYFEAARIFGNGQLPAASPLLPPAVSATGTALIVALLERGLTAETALYATAVLRAGTFWVTVLVAMLATVAYQRWRGAPRGAANHFDHIADHYARSFPEHMRRWYLSKKVEVNTRYLPPERYRTGIDAGCGQGWHLAEMLARGYAVIGIDVAASQARHAKDTVRRFARDCVAVGSIAELPVRSASQDFLYSVNVVHHLGSRETQARAFREAWRVLRPGGRLVIHEMNVRNPLFRLYLGYIFPLFRDIDDGTEIWLKGSERHLMQGFTQVAVEYRTFLPEFLPAGALRGLGRLEKAAEESRLVRRWAAHVTYVLQKDQPGAPTSTGDAFP